MTWLWFALIGILALMSRKSISSWLGNWSVDALKRLAAGGLVAFGVMATFGLGLGTQILWLHVAAGLGGVLGFFALSEIANRRSASERFAQYERLRARMSNLGERPEQPEGIQREEKGSFSAKNIPPLIKENDSEKSILDLLTTAAEHWENPEVDIGSASAPAETSTHRPRESVAQIMKRDNEEAASEEPAYNAELVAGQASEAAAEPIKPSPGARETKSLEEAEVELKPLIVTEEPISPLRETAMTATPQEDERSDETERNEEVPASEKATTASVLSAIDRASGPISLDAATAGEPVGPLSLRPTPARQSSTESSSAKPVPFVYRPLLVTSRLGGTDTGAQRDEARDEAGEQEDQETRPDNHGGEPTTDD